MGCANEKIISERDVNEVTVGVTSRDSVRNRLGKPKNTMLDGNGSCDMYVNLERNWAGKATSARTAMFCYDKSGILRVAPTGQNLPEK